MKHLFRNSEHLKAFEEKGYVIIPFFSNEEVQALLNIYAGVKQTSAQPFYSSSFIENEEEKITYDKKAREIFTGKINQVFKNYKPLGTSFLTKKSGENSEMPIHQDWTVVNENEFCSITCWVSLQDTNHNNGAIQVIEGSHLFSDALRSPSLPVSFEKIYPQLQPFLKTLNLKAGEAFVFNHALMHASHKNLSGSDRVAVTFGLTHKDAAMLMYYGKENKVEKWLMPDDMFIRFPKIRFKPEIGQKVEAFSYTVPELTIDEVRTKIMISREKRKMKPLFRNSEHQDFFEKNGYIKLPALEQEQINSLIELYKRSGFKDEKGYGFYVGMDDKDKNKVTEMVNTISGVAMPSVEKYLYETQLFTASFVNKDPNPQGVVPPHQDWSFVENENQHCSATCWIPLQDVNIDNGCMGVIKGSNHFFDSERPSPSPQVGAPIKEHMFTIFPFLQLVEMKAGEALIFNNKTIHASPPNITNNVRLAVGLGFTQKEAAISHYFLKPGTTDTLLKYSISPDFFFKYDNSSLSEMYDKGQTIEGYGTPEEVPYRFEKLSAEELVKRITDAGNTYNAALVARMAQLFNYNPDATKKEETAAPVETPEPAHVNNVNSELPLWKVYTPMNILREIKHRLAS